MSRSSVDDEIEDEVKDLHLEQRSSKFLVDLVNTLRVAPDHPFSEAGPPGVEVRVALHEAPGLTIIDIYD